jgi:hypothetical protein
MWKKGEVHTGVEWGNMRGRGHLKGIRVDGRIILKRVFNKWDGGMDWIVLAENRDRVIGYCCECSNEHSDSVNFAGNFLTRWGSVSFSGRTLLHGVSLLINFVVMNRSS